MRLKETENYIYNLVYQCVSIAYPLILTPYTARVFGADGVGDYSFTVSVVTLFTLILTCIGRYGFREVSYGKGNRAEESQAFWSVFYLKTILFIGIFLGYIVLILNSGKYKALFIAQLISIVYAWLEVGWYWQGIENFKVTATVSILNKVILLVSVFLLVKTKEDLALYAFVVSSVTFLGGISLWPKLIDRLSKPRNIELRKHIKSCILICIPFVIIELYSSLDKMMIGLISDDSFQNGYYEQTIKITKVVMVVLTSMSLIKAPRHSGLAKNNKEEELRESLYESISFMVLLGVAITFGLCIIADKCVPLFLGDGYEVVVTLMYLYSPFMILHGFVDILANQYFVPTKKQNKYTIAVGISCVSNIILNLFLISWKGAAGAIVATVVAEVISCGVLLVYAKGMFSVKRLISDNYMFIIAGIIMFNVCVLLAEVLTVNRVVEMTLQILTGAIVYFSVLLLVRQKYFMSIVSSVKNTIIKRRRNRV